MQRASLLHRLLINIHLRHVSLRSIPRLCNQVLTMEVRILDMESESIVTNLLYAFQAAEPSVDIDNHYSSRIGDLDQALLRTVVCHFISA